MPPVPPLYVKDKRHLQSGLDYVQRISQYSNQGSHQGLSFDAAMFPFLHPGGHGAFRSGESLSTMLKQRMQQLLTPFCLQKEYMLLMYQVARLHAYTPARRQASLLASPLCICMA
jgi:hypothetical protein